MAPAPTPPPSVRPRRRWRWLLVACALLVALGAAVPLLAPAYVAGLIEERIERELEADVELTGFSASLGGRARLDGLQVVRLDGRPLASLGPAAGSFDPWGLFSGRIQASLQVDGFELHVQERAGALDVGLRRTGDGTGGGTGGRTRGETDGGGRPAEAPGAGPRPEPLPDLRLDLDLKRGRIVVHGERGVTTLDDLELTFHLDDAAEPARAQLGFRIEAPDGEAGRVDARADVTLAPDGDFRPERVRSDVQYALGDVRLEALEPLLGGLLPGREVSGVLSGNGVFQAVGWLDAEGEGRLALRDVSVTDRSRADGTPVPLPALDLALAATRTADGSGTQSLEMEARGLFRLVWEGALAPGPDGDLLTGALSWDGRLDNIHRAAGALVDLGPAVAEGAMGVRADVELRLAGGEPAAATVDARVQTVELAYDDGAGTRVWTERGELTPHLVWEAGSGDGGADDARGSLTGGLSFDRVTLGLAGREVPLTELALDYTATLAGQRPRLEADGGLVLHEGPVSFELSVDAGQEPSARSTLVMKADGVRAQAETAELLAALHPLFARAGEGGETHGLLTLDTQVALDGPLPADGEPFPLPALSARGRLELADVGISAPSELAELLDRFGLDTRRGLSVRPLSLDLHDGRVHYAEPWGFDVDGQETSFSGSVGLDGSLDLAWSLPVTESLTDRYGFLEALESESIVLPVTGTTAAPRVEWDALLDELRAGLVEDKVDELQRQIDVLRGEADEDPAALLAAADALWDEGRAEEARPIYERLREEFRLSLVYVLNRDRIKDRAEEPKPESSKKKNKKKKEDDGGGA